MRVVAEVSAPSVGKDRMSAVLFANDWWALWNAVGTESLDMCVELVMRLDVCACVRRSAHGAHTDHFEGVSLRRYGKTEIAAS